jgi:Major tropism determinant N-terminal domain
MPRITDVRLRRGAASAWANANPTLGDGEPGLETDTGNLKFGDGVNSWAALPYFSANGGPVQDTNILEAVPLIIYGNSYTQPRASTNLEWPARLFDRLRMGSISNRGYSGIVMGQLAYELNNNVSGATDPNRGWSTGTKGLVVIEESINDTVTFGSSTKALKAYEMALRVMCESISAATRYDAPNAAFTYTGTWTSGTAYLKNSGKRTTVVGSKVTFSITGTGFSVYYMGNKDSTEYAVCDLKVDGVSKATIDTRDQMDPYNAPGSVGTGIGVNLCMTKITGLTSGAHTVEISLTSKVGAGGFYFDGYSTPDLVKPAQIILLKEGVINNYNPNGSDSARQLYNAKMDVVAADYSNVTVADPGTAWDLSCLNMYDGTGNHPNDKGAKILTDAVQRAALSLGFRDGMHEMA